MGPRIAIVVGLILGVATAAIVFAALVAFVPESGSAPTPIPTPPPSVAASTTPGPSAPASTTPGPSAPASAAPGGSPGGSPAASAGASGAASPVPSSGGAFMIGQPAPTLVVDQLGGGRVDLAGSVDTPSGSTSWRPGAHRAKTSSRS